MRRGGSPKDVRCEFLWAVSNDSCRFARNAKTPQGLHRQSLFDCGLGSFPALGYYNATKFAVEGFSEALWQEVEPLGIKVMLVEPSGFRTDWAGRSANETEHQISDYANTAEKNIRHLRKLSGNQDGDPVRAAEAIVHAVESANPPHRLLLGNDAYDGAMAKLDELREEFTAWEEASRGADFPESTPAVTA